MSMEAPGCGGTMTTPNCTMEPPFERSPSTEMPSQRAVRNTIGVTGCPSPARWNPAGSNACALAVETRPTPILSTQPVNSTAKLAGASKAWHSDGGTANRAAATPIHGEGFILIWVLLFNRCRNGLEKYRGTLPTVMSLTFRIDS